MDSPMIPGKFSHAKFENPMQARLRRLYLDDVMSNSKEMLFFTKEKDKGKFELTFTWDSYYLIFDFVSYDLTKCNEFLYFCSV